MGATRANLLVPHASACGIPESTLLSALDYDKASWLLSRTGFPSTRLKTILGRCLFLRSLFSFPFTVFEVLAKAPHYRTQVFALVPRWVAVNGQAVDQSPPQVKTGVADAEGIAIVVEILALLTSLQIEVDCRSTVWEVVTLIHREIASMSDIHPEVGTEIWIPPKLAKEVVIYAHPLSILLCVVVVYAHLIDPFV
jgi:hypothetical protein